MPAKKTNRVDIYEIVTNQILDKLENGTVPWQKPWSVKTGAPCNLITGKPYHGINVMLLGSQAYDSKYWLTYKQCSDKGGQVQKGEKGSMVVFWNFVDKKTGKSLDSDDVSTGSAEKIPMLRFYTVFNANQCANLDVKRLAEEIESRGLGQDNAVVKPAQEIMNQYVDAPVIKHGYTRACYRPLDDEINMPKMEHFKSSDEYFSTLFHEAIHSTGHESRLNRQNSSDMRVFGDSDYSKEELVAEMGAAFLCAQAGIDATLDNSAAYVKSWMKALQDDKKLLITAAGQAQKAAAYISESLGNTVNLDKQYVNDALDDGLICEEVIDILQGERFNYQSSELARIVRTLIESPDRQLLCACIESGTISSHKALESVTHLPQHINTSIVRF